MGTAGWSVFSYRLVEADTFLVTPGLRASLGCLTTGLCCVLGDPISSSVLTKQSKNCVRFCLLFTSMMSISLVDVGEGILGTPGIGTDGMSPGILTLGSLSCGVGELRGLSTSAMVSPMMLWSRPDRDLCLALSALSFLLAGLLGTVGVSRCLGG